MNLTGVPDFLNILCESLGVMTDMGISDVNSSSFVAMACSMKMSDMEFSLIPVFGATMSVAIGVELSEKTG